MSRVRIFVPLALFLMGCSSSLKDGYFDQRFEQPTSKLRDCMPYVHMVRSENDIPPALTFIRNISQTIFSCEYFRGRSIRYHGSFGQKLKINGQTVYAGWGYAITDKSQELAELLNVSNFAGRYPSSRNVIVNVKEKPIDISGYSRMLKVYFVNVSGRYIGKRTIAALGMFDFYKKRQGYRLFLWVQGYHLTEDEVSRRFSILMGFVVVSSVSVTKK